MKVVILVPGIPTQYGLLSEEMILKYLVEQGHEVVLARNCDPGIHNGRNALLANGQDWRADTKPWGEDYDRILWLDSDIVLPVPGAMKLLEADADIVSGLYPMGPGLADVAVAGASPQEAPHPFMNRLRIGAIMGLDDDAHSVLHEVDFVGFGCLMVRKGVFEKMLFPWFDSLYDTLPDGRVINLGEDFGWCRKAKSLGFTIYVHRHVRAKHEKLVVV